MLTQLHYKNLKVLVSDYDVNALPLFRKFIEGALSCAKVELLSNGPTGPVYKIEFEGRKYVLKHDLRKRHRFDFLVQSLIRGSNAFRLLRSLEKASEKTPEETGFARVFLVADRRLFGRVVLESFILMEFVEGLLVSTIPDGIVRYKNECVRIVRWLHENNIVHGDVHPGNFIVDAQTQRVKVIDIAGKYPTELQKAFDCIRTEEKFGVEKIRDDSITKCARAIVERRKKRRAKRKG